MKSTTGPYGVCIGATRIRVANEKFGNKNAHKIDHFKNFVAILASDEMGRTKAEKLYEYVSRGEVPKVKAYLKKHHHDRRINVNAAVPDRAQCQRTLLHLVCASGDDAMLRVLMKHGARADMQDCYGDTPLHLALVRVLHGHRHAFKDLVLPILEKSKSSGILDIANEKGHTARQLLQDVEQMSQQRAEHKKREFEMKREAEEKQKEEAKWHSRLEEEWVDEMPGIWEYTMWDEQGYTGQRQESFDEWANRIAAEHRQRQQQQQQHRYQQFHPSCSRCRKQAHEREQQQEEKQNFQRKLEEEHTKYQRRQSERLQKRLLQQKAEYLKRCEQVFGADDGELGKLRFGDIPWPCRHNNTSKMVEVLMCDVQKDDLVKTRRFVRSQLLLWHPDKFLQKCGSRLVEDDRDKIMERVTELSQALNQMIEDDKGK